MKKKILCLLLTAVLTVTVTMQGLVLSASAESVNTSLLLGDANLDGIVNIKDATSIQKSLATITEFGEMAMSAADVDGNEEITIKDATAVQKWLADIDVEYLIGELFDFIAEIVSNGGAILLSINPEIKIHFNPEGNVTAVEGINTDGEALIAEYKGYEGKNCKAVIDELVTLASEAGYLVDDIDGENKMIIVQLESGVTAPKHGFMDELKKGVEDKTKKLDVKPEIIDIDFDDYDSKYKSETVPSPYITLDKAIEIALAYANIWAEDAVFIEKEYDLDDGTPYYELEFNASGFEFECEINAQNGKVTDFEKEKQPNTPENSTVTNEYISLEQAKEIALNHAGVAASDAVFSDREIDLEDGTPYYELEFTASGFEYEYKIHGVSGKVIKFEAENDDDIYNNDINNNGNHDNHINNNTHNDDNSDDIIPTNPEFIGVDNAKAIALNHANVNAENAIFDKAEFDRDDGVPSYELEFKASGIDYEYDIHAQSGEIINFEVDENKHNLHDNQNDVYDKDAVIPTNPDYISVDNAKEIALNHANVATENAVFEKSELDIDDGVPSYELEFKASGLEYEYSINATDGTIIEAEYDRIDD